MLSTTFFTTPRMTSGPHASACAVSDRFLHRRPPVLGLVASHLRLNLSDVVGGRRSWCRGRVVLRYHVETARCACDTCGVGRGADEAPTVSPASWAQVYRGCHGGTHPCDASSRVMKRESPNTRGRCKSCCGDEWSRGRVVCTRVRSDNCTSSPTHTFGQSLPSRGRPTRKMMVFSSCESAISLRSTKDELS